MKMCTNTFCPCCFFFCIFIYSIEIKLFFQFFSPKAPQCGRPHNIQYGEPRDVKNRGFTANLDKR